MEENKPAATVLTIDDEQPLRRSIKEYLEDFGYNVIEAEDGGMGIEIFQEEKSDLLLVDLLMPGTDGLEVLKFVRENSPETPVIVISGVGDISYVVDALRLGAWDYILKPIQDMTVLLHSVRKALERADLLRAKRLYREKLEVEVAERTKELRAANETLSREVQVRKQVEEEIEKTKHYLTCVFDSISAVLISINGEGVVTQWNKVAENFTGIPETQAVNKKVWQLAPFLKEYKADAAEVQKTGKPGIWQCKALIHEKKRHLQISMFPLAHDCDGGVVIQVEDKTELRKKDEQLRQAQKMETLGVLAGGLAHDFNNVLGGIIGPLSIIQEEIQADGIAVDVLKKYLDDIDKSANRAADIVKHLLALSRKEDLAFKAVDLNDVIRHVMKICQNTFDKRIELAPLYSRKPAQVSADHAQLEQVLLNLCVNSAHAMTIMREEGERWGGTLTISLTTIQADSYFCEIHPGASVGSYWKLSVEDNGVGMSPGTLSQIFSPFFTTKGKTKGTGLGLAMVYNIIKQHKGFVSVYSEADKGTMFNVYLPQLMDDAGAEEEGPLEEEKLKGKGLILVVEDEPIMRKVAVNMLESSGYDVLVAKDGEEAMPLFRKYHRKIKLVLLDMLMPRKSGAETYTEMKRINPGLKVLLNSGFRRDERVEEALALGMDGFIEKPYTKNQLLKAVHQVLNK